MRVLEFIRNTYGFDPLNPNARMTPKRKAAVVEAVKRHVLSLEQAMTIHSLSRDEFDEWIVRYEQFGLSGMGTTKRPWLQDDEARR